MTGDDVRGLAAAARSHAGRSPAGSALPLDALFKVALPLTDGNHTPARMVNATGDGEAPAAVEAKGYLMS